MTASPVFRDTRRPIKALGGQAVDHARPWQVNRALRHAGVATSVTCHLSYGAVSLRLLRAVKD
ncbi:hypothetical protein E2C01_008973 [Portunus trituberculatus]|uniref:Uncharacterized protein n=1 Tax=Portunus trituberculatus TaxID=210409 RepID=A0A5B7D5N2_PORTR|nr:hypothetical protein [Portunus trituberculatus]